MKTKTQILYIHGGMTFKNQKDYLHFLKTRKIAPAQEHHENIVIGSIFVRE